MLGKARQRRGLRRGTARCAGPRTGPQVAHHERRPLSPVGRDALATTIGVHTLRQLWLQNYRAPDDPRGGAAAA